MGYGLKYREKGGEICAMLSPGNIPIHRTVESFCSIRQADETK